MSHDFNWRPGIGDPSIGGWITVALYLLACVSCWRTTLAVRRLGRNEQYDGRIWRAISLVFFFLGINKQLDLQSAMTELGRLVAYSGGWYEQRRIVQFYFIIGVAAIAASALVVLLLWSRRSPIQTWIATVGSSFVLGFVVIRAASFHHFDRFIDSRLLGFRWNWILEMGGIAIVLLASEWRRAKTLQALRPASRTTAASSGPA